jgi:AAA domain
MEQDHAFPDDARRRSLSPAELARLSRFKAYAISHTLLQEVDLHLCRAIEEPAGFAYVLLYGPSGVGKTTLIRQLEYRSQTQSEVEQAGTGFGTPPHKLPARRPVLLLEVRPPDGSTFDRSDYYRIALKQLGEQTYERRMLVAVDEGHAWERGPKKVRSQAAPFNDSAELRQAYEAALLRWGVRAILLDEAQHLLKLASGVKLIDQLDWLKSLANTTGVLHILTGTYELLALRNLNGQTARRGLEIHFPRYQFQHQPDQEAFQRALLTLLQHVPLEVDVESLVVNHWSYFYERSIGCIGVLKDWLVRAVAASLADKAPTLLFERLQECALPIAQCESMAMEAASGEQELRYTASRRQHLWALLGMPGETQGPNESAVPTPKQQRDARVGEPKPKRYEVGESKEEKQAEKCSFSHAIVPLSPAQFAQTGVAKLQCPECGAIWTARVRGEVVSFPPHQSLQRPRARAIPRWIRQGTAWTRT